MPFPFKVLPYGFKQRFHELATPVEIYHLQTAAGPDIQDLRPTIKVKEIENFTLRFNDTNKASEINPELADFDGVFISVASITFENLKFTHVSDPIFDQLYNDVDEIEFENCVVDYALLRKISPISYSPEGYCLFFNHSTFKEHISLYSLLTLFPKCRRLDIYSQTYIYKGWIKDLLKVRTTKLEVLDLTGASRDLFTLKPQKLAKFICNQCDDFRLDVDCVDVDRPALFLRRLKRFLGKPFTDVIEVTKTYNRVYSFTKKRG